MAGPEVIAEATSRTYQLIHMTRDLHSKLFIICMCFIVILAFVLDFIILNYSIFHHPLYIMVQYVL